MPFSRFPFFYNPSYYNRFSNYNNYFSKFNNNSAKNYSINNKNANAFSNKVNNENFFSNQPEDERVSNNVSINSKNQLNKSTDDNYFFELFGLKLFFDDVLLICIIFFLYQEGVKDTELFLSLILLLLS